MTGPAVTPQDSNLPPLHRILTPDEFHQAKQLSPDALAGHPFPVLPPAAPSESTRAGSVAKQKDGTGGVPLTGIPRLLTKYIAQPMLDHPLMTAATAVIPYAGYAMAGLMGKDVLEYGAQKAAELSLPPDVRKMAEADPTRISGEQAAMEAGLLAVAPLVHGAIKGGKAIADTPIGQTIKGHVAAVSDSWKSMFAPATRTPEAMQAANIMRSTTGHGAAAYEQAAFKLDEFRRAIDPLPDADKLGFIDAIEGGKSQPAPEFQPAADAIRATLDQTREQIRALGTGKLDHFIEDYFPHIWSDADRAGEAFKAAPKEEPVPEAAPAPETRTVEGGNVGRVPREGAQGALYKGPDLAEAYYGDDTDLRRAFMDGFNKGDTRGSLVDPKQVAQNGFREGTPHWTAWQQGFKEAYDPTQAGSGLPEGVRLTPSGQVGVEGGTVTTAGEPPAAPADALQKAKIRTGGKAPFEGSKSFLKQRTIPTTADGMAMGLTPVTTNPLDLTLLKLREMQRYLTAHQTLNELKDNGLVTFVHAGEMPPEGHAPINDKIATVFGPRTGGVTLPEGSMTPGEAPVKEMVGVRDNAGNLRRNLGNVATEHLEDEWRRLAELNATEHAQAAGIKESGYRADYEELPRTEKLGRKGQEDLPDADGTMDPDVLADHNKTLREYNRNTIVRAARDKAMKRIETEMAGRPDATDFNFGANAYRANGEIPGMRPMKPSDVTVSGTRIMGAYHAPEAVAKIVNNYLSPGLRGNAIYDAYRGLGNALNQAQLGFSAFHLGMTSLDASVSRAALGMEYLKDGDLLHGAQKIAASPLAPIPGVFQGTVGDLVNAAPARVASGMERGGVIGYGKAAVNAIPALVHSATGDMQFGLGAKIRDAYLNPDGAPPEMQALANAVKEAGGRVKQDSFYQNSAPAKMVEAWKAGEYGKATALSLPSLIEATSKPLMEHIVPLQKLGVFGELAQKALADLPPEATLADRRAALSGAWDSVDNRMGQLVYDNLFWNKTFKDLAMGGVRSVGWNLGTIRELGGGAVDLAGMAKDAIKGDPVEMTHKAAYALALPLTVGMYGAAYQYLRTGQGPSELKDYFFPKTGEQDADGNDERVQLPSYMKDVFSYADHPVNTVGHKFAPLLSSIQQMMTNQDFYGDEIRNPDDDAVKQLGQEASFVAKSVIPFSLQGMMEDTKRGDQSAPTKLGNWFGITPAPREKVRSDAQNRMADIMSTRHTTGATPEDAEARKSRSEILSAMRGGNPDGTLEKAVTDAIERHQLTPGDIGKLLKRAGTTPAQEKFKMLTLPQAIDVFKRATPAEQAKFGELLVKKIGGAK